MEGSQVSTSSLVSGGEAMLVAEIIKLGLREGLEDLPSPEGPLLPGFPFKILGFYFPPPVLLPVPYLFPYLFVHLLAYELAPTGHRGVF